MTYTLIMILWMGAPIVIHDDYQTEKACTDAGDWYLKDSPKIFETYICPGNP